MAFTRKNLFGIDTFKEWCKSTFALKSHGDHVSPDTCVTSVNGQTGKVTVSTGSSGVTGIRLGSSTATLQTGEITVTPSDIGAATSGHTHSNYALTSHTHSGYASSDHNHDSSYAAKSHTHTASSGFIPALDWSKLVKLDDTNPQASSEGSGENYKYTVTSDGMCWCYPGQYGDLYINGAAIFSNNSYTQISFPVKAGDKITYGYKNGMSFFVPFKTT